MVFFIADTHFGHKNVLKLYDRPFETIRWFSCFITQESFIWFRLFLFPKNRKEETIRTVTKDGVLAALLIHTQNTQTKYSKIVKQNTPKYSNSALQTVAYML